MSGFFNFRGINHKQKVFNYALVINVLVFLILYYFIVYRNTVTFYSRNSNLKEVLIFSFGNLKLLYISFFFAFWRVYRFFVKKDRLNLFFDSMLFSGIVYALANIILKLPLEYYYFPAVMLTLPALIYWAAKLLHPKWMLIVILMLTVYYGRKFPRVIASVQGQRTETSKNIIELTNNVRSATDIFWFVSSSNDLAKQGIIGYQRDILEVYLKFYDPLITKLDIKNIKMLPDSARSGTVLFYSDLNNEKPKDMENLGYKKLNLPNIYEMSIYLKK